MQIFPVFLLNIPYMLLRASVTSVAHATIQLFYLASRIFFVGWVCCTSKPTLTIAIIFYSKSPWVCIANSCDFTFTHDFIDIDALACVADTSYRIEFKSSNPWDEIRTSLRCHPVISHFCILFALLEVQKRLTEIWCHHFSWIHCNNAHDLVFISLMYRQICI